MQDRKLVIGWVNYWNLFPLKSELGRLCPHQFEAVNGTPRFVNTKLLRGEVDVAPSSSVCLLDDLHLRMALPLGVACDGDVQSVYLGFRSPRTEVLDTIVARNAMVGEICREALARHGHDMRGVARHLWGKVDTISVPWFRNSPRVALSPHSATSNALLRILYRFWFGEGAYNDVFVRRRQHDDADIQLVIGDEALQNARKFYHHLDLGNLWKKMTGLPFVFAVWQSYSALSSSWRQRLLRAAELATAKMRVDPSCYLTELSAGAYPEQKINLSEYWKNINYLLKAKEQRSLYLFLNLYRPLLAERTASEFVEERLVHWGRLANHATETEVGV